MVTDNTLNAKEIKALIHAHAAQLISETTGMPPARALFVAADLAVMAFNSVELARILRMAADKRGLPDTLARIVAPEGGASLALARVDGPSETDE